MLVSLTTLKWLLEWAKQKAVSNNCFSERYFLSETIRTARSFHCCRHSKNCQGRALIDVQNAHVLKLIERYQNANEESTKVCIPVAC